MMPSKRYDIILYGGPGSGKSTQAELLATSLNGVAIHVGKRLRALSKEDNPVGKKIAKAIDKGNLIPHSQMKALAKQWIAEIPTSKPIILDGATRDPGEAMWLDGVLKDQGRQAVAVYLKLPIAVAKARLIQRAKKDNRKDDLDPVAIANRVNLFKTESKTILGYYKDQNRLITIDGKLTINQIHKAILKELDQWHLAQTK